MKRRITFIIEYFILWWAYFLSARTIFLAYQHELSAKISIGELLKTYFYGSRLDISTAAFLVVIPLVLLLFTFGKAPFPKIRNAIFGYSALFVSLLSLMVFVDPELYSAWGFRLDSTPLVYIKNPNEMTASMGNSPVLLLFLGYLLFCIAWIYVFYRFIRENFEEWTTMTHYKWLIVNVFCIAFLILPMRGGTQLAPVNQSSVYFSNNPFLNHSAINVAWNFFHSVLQTGFSETNPYVYLEQSQAQNLVNDINLPVPTDIWVTDTIKKKPNVIIITWESLTAKIVRRLDGKTDITNNIDSLCNEGVLFTNIYATGDRTEKGLIGVLSALPALPQNSWMKEPRKTSKIASLSQRFRENGYRTSFFYGGETDFANMKSYLYNSNFETMVQKSDFETRDCNSKWGAYDHVVLNKALKDISLMRTPFFANILTLSSHEPFEVPVAMSKQDYKTLKDETDLFLNSMTYTDYCVGEFIRKAKNQSWWNNTIVLIVADHGHRLPAGTSRFDDFRIPILMLGGALKQCGIVINTVGSQTDIAATLLGQCQLPFEGFVWSKNILSSQNKPSAYFAFQNGFGYVEPFGSFIYDALGNEVIQQNGIINEDRLQKGKAMAQQSYQYFLNR